MKDNLPKQLIQTEKPWLFELENDDDMMEIADVCRALSSPIRLEILKMLNNRNYIMSEIADELNLQPSSAAFHLKILENAKLITVNTSTKYKGTLRYYSYSIRDIMIRLRKVSDRQVFSTPVTYTIKIGEYSDAAFSLYSGLASGEKLLVENHPGMMFGKERFQAEYLYNTRAGFLKYNIPNEYVKEGKLSELQISMEISSETFGYNEDYPSDITFSINGIELCTWTCPGSYGDKYGVYTPSWWYPESAKYGLLTTIKIKEKGVFINEEPFNRNIGLSNLNLSDGIYTEFKIEVKPNAKHCGGFCLFGENFGNHNQAIVFTAFYRK